MLRPPARHRAPHAAPPASPPAPKADVADLDLYLHNVKWSGTGVLLAPRAAIRRARLQLPVGYELRSYFAVQPEAAGAVLEGVRARSYMSVSGDGWGRGPFLRVGGGCCCAC